VGLQTHKKNHVLQKTSFRKVLTKKSTKTQNRFFLDFFIHVFGHFFGEGSSKTRSKKISEKISDPIPFSYSDPPTHHGGHRFFVLPAP
jgi:hypothetical protein